MLDGSFPYLDTFHKVLDWNRGGQAQKIGSALTGHDVWEATALCFLNAVDGGVPNIAVPLCH